MLNRAVAMVGGRMKVWWWWFFRLANQGLMSTPIAPIPATPATPISATLIAHVSATLLWVLVFFLSSISFLVFVKDLFPSFYPSLMPYSMSPFRFDFH